MPSTTTSPNLSRDRDMRAVVAFGTVADSAVADEVRRALVDDGFDLVDVSEVTAERHTWPQVGQSVAAIVARQQAATGVALCWTGSGVAISASIIPGTRAAFCSNPAEATSAREWHDANVLALSLWADPAVAVATVRAWLQTDASRDSRHVAARLALAS